jgi:hypothetical protein
LDLKPGSQEYVRPSADKAGEFFGVKLGYREGNELMPVVNSGWPLAKDNRTYVLFFTTGDGRISYRAVDEFMAIEAPAP